MTKNPEGKIKLHQPVNLAVICSFRGRFWGLLIGMIFMMPAFGLAIGAAAGAITGALSDVGIDDHFNRQLSEKILPNSSVLFILIRNMTDDRVLPEIEKFGGTILKTSLSDQDQGKLEAALRALSNPGKCHPLPSTWSPQGLDRGLTGGR